MSISAQGLGIKYKEQLTNISATEGHVCYTRISATGWGLSDDSGNKDKTM